MSHAVTSWSWPSSLSLCSVLSHFIDGLDEDKQNTTVPSPSYISVILTLFFGSFFMASSVNKLDVFLSYSQHCRRSRIWLLARSARTHYVDMACKPSRAYAPTRRRTFPEHTKSTNCGVAHGKTKRQSSGKSAKSVFCGTGTQICLPTIPQEAKVGPDSLIVRALLHFGLSQIAFTCTLPPLILRRPSWAVHIEIIDTVYASEIMTLPSSCVANFRVTSILLTVT